MIYIISHREPKIEPQWVSITCTWLKWKRLTIPSVDENTGKLKYSDTVGENVK